MKNKRLLSLLCACAVVSGTMSTAVICAEEETEAEVSVSVSDENEETYSITYKTGSALGKVENTEPVKAGENVELSVWALRRDGFSHTGWTDGENTYKRGESIEMPAKDLVLEPVWKKIYTVIYENLEVYGYDSPFRNGTVAPGTEISLPPLVMHNGDAMFYGWTVNGEYYAGGTKFIMPEQDVEVNVFWLEPVYIDYYAGDLEGVTGNPHFLKSAYPGFDTDISNGERLIRLGYKLTGWYDPADNNKVYEFTDSIIVPENGVTLMARWEPLKIGMKFRANGGTGKMSNQVELFDSYVRIKECEFEKEGYKLHGWKHDEDYYQPEGTVQVKVKEYGDFMEFDAVWIEEDRNPGDLDGDGDVDIADLSLLSLHVIGDAEITDEKILDDADVQRDGEVNTADLARMKQFISKEKILLGTEE